MPGEEIMQKKIFYKLLALVLASLLLLSSCASQTSSEKETNGSEKETNGSESGNTENLVTDATEAPTDAEQSTGGLTEAEPKPKHYSVVYLNSENGRISGQREQSVERGKSSSKVTAVADEGYIFAGWSDGYTFAQRVDENVRDDIEVSPIFVSVDYEFSVTYEVLKDGELVDINTLSAKATELISYAPNDAPLAYIYTEWSDGVAETKRADSILSDGKKVTIDCVPHALEVPVLEIETEDGRGIESKSEYKRCTVTLSNFDEDGCFENAEAKIRGRGNSSWTYPKKGFKLKFDNKRSMLGSDYKAKDWVFISNYGDKSLLRNMIAYDISDQLSGLDFTTIHEFIDVYLNGEYYGIFLMCDSIETGEGRYEFDEELKEDPAEMGYLIEIGMTDPEGVGIDCVRMGRDYNRSYGLNFPYTDDPDYDPDVYLTYIGDYLDQCLAALSATDWDLICELIDVDSFVDYYVIQELFMNKDCFWRSVHFYKEPGGKLYAGPVWDFDQGLGNVSDLFGLGAYDTTPDIDIDFEDKQYNSNKKPGSLWIAAANTWYRRLFRNEEFKALVYQRLVECKPIIDEVLAMTTTDGSNPNSYYSLYKGSMERNFERWKIMGTGVWPNTPYLVSIKTVTGQIDYVHEWIEERYQILLDWYD